MRTPIPALCVLLFFLAGCGSRRPPLTEFETTPPVADFAALAEHAPPFVRVPYEPFTRAEALAIATQEWLRFGSHVDDDPPSPDGIRLTPETDPARAPGHWERIGEYWWLGQDANRYQAAWTGMHDSYGRVFDLASSPGYAWSAAFISYVMKTAGAGPRFPYSPSHSTYIDIGKEMAQGRTSGWAIFGYPLNAYAPVPGDLICAWRDKHPITYAALPRAAFPSHCDIVVARNGQWLSVIGGNVDHTVTMKHVPVTESGTLAEADGDRLDSRYHWFVVLRVLYDR